MKVLFLLMLMGCCFWAGAQTTWVVSNSPDFPGHFSDLQKAINSSDVQPGHILLVQGSPANYGDIEVNKKVIIMGPGYFLGENPETQANLMSAKLNSVHFLPDAAGSVMQGMEITGSAITETFLTRCSNLIGTNYSVLIESNAIGIISNRLHQALVIKSAFTGLIIKNFLNFFHVIDTSSHITVSNNIITGDFTAINSNVRNNILDAQVECRYIALENCSVDRNIFLNSCPLMSCMKTSEFTNNVFTTNPLGEDIGSNIVGVSIAELFVAAPGTQYKSTDGRFLVRPNSPAAILNAGPFVGLNPYKLSGISLHPNIYSVTMPNTVTDGSGLKIEVKVRANE